MPGSPGCSKFAALTLLFLFGLFWSGITLAVDVVWATGAYRQLVAISYPTVEGVVTGSKVVPAGRRSTSAKITYSYQVGNNKYASDRYRYRESGSSDGNAQRIVDQLPIGRRVTVHYSPDDPSDAVLFAGIDGSDLFLAMFMTPFNAVMVSIWMGLAGGIRKSSRPPVAGGVQFWDDGFQLRVRLPRLAPWVVGLGLLATASFLLTFVVVFAAGGFNPPLALMVAVWLLLLLGAFLAYLIAKLRVISGRADMIIDDMNGAVTLPQTFGRKEPQTLASGQLRSLVIEDVLQRGSKGTTSHSYVPTLIWEDPQGTERREKLGEWSDSARAEEFAAWLRLRLKFNAIDRQRTRPIG